MSLLSVFVSFWSLTASGHFLHSLHCKRAMWTFYKMSYLVFNIIICLLICTCNVLTLSWSFLFSISPRCWILVFVYKNIWPHSPLSLSFAFFIWQDVMNYRKTNMIRQSCRMPISTMHRVSKNISHSLLKPFAHGNTDLGRFLALHPQFHSLDATHELWGKPPCAGTMDQTSGPQRVFVPHTDIRESVCDRDHMELLGQFVILPGFSRTSW